jgi:hypothetical protein
MKTNVVALLAITVATIGFSKVVVASSQPAQHLSGSTMFAVLYILAQATERLLEPLSGVIGRRANKATLLWVAATVLAMFGSAMTGVSLLSLLGITTARWFDILVTGLAVGGGTKPLHDLIGFIQSEKDIAKVASSTPAGE